MTARCVMGARREERPRPLITWVWVAVVAVWLVLLGSARWDGDGSVYVPDRPVPPADVWCSGPNGCVNGGGR